MSIKAKAPQEDPETKARREAAEDRAETARIEETQSDLRDETLAVMRQFGAQPTGPAPVVQPRTGSSGGPLTSADLSALVRTLFQ